MEWYGGIEAGGTKFNCMVASDPGNILAESRISTTTPDQTLPRVAEFFIQVEKKHGIHIGSLGLATFGPIDLNENSPKFGYITSTPKIVWQNLNILGYFKQALQIPVNFDVDVIGAALGEGKWGSAQDCKDYVYITVGTGIGGGVIINGHPVHGLVHPELGHIFIPHDKEVDDFSGNCPIHGDCLEGLASGPSIQARWGVKSEDLPADHPAWKLEARYLGYLLANVVLSFSPQRVILGGGVMKTPGLVQMARKEMLDILNGYVKSENLIDHPESFVQNPGLGDRSGILGAIVLAQAIN
jgi:fructokinase